jgi:hypothetical protein
MSLAASESVAAFHVSLWDHERTPSGGQRSPSDRGRANYGQQLRGPLSVTVPTQRYIRRGSSCSGWRYVVAAGEAPLSAAPAWQIATAGQPGRGPWPFYHDSRAATGPNTFTGGSPPQRRLQENPELVRQRLLESDLTDY